MSNKNCGHCYNRGCWYCEPSIRAAQMADSVSRMEALQSGKSVRANDDVLRHRVAAELCKAMEADGRYGHVTLSMALDLADVALRVAMPL